MTRPRKAAEPHCGNCYRSGLELTLGLCARCTEWAAIWPNGWEPGITQPGAAFGDPGPLPTECAVTVLMPRLRPERELQYRGACMNPNCRWVGPVVDRENTATEDAHDHVWPGWRDLPVVEMPRRTGDSKRDLRAMQAVELELRKVYPPDWPKPGAPTRAWRDPAVSRHVPGASPWGGYEMAVVRDAAADSEPALLEQLSLPLLDPEPDPSGLASGRRLR